MKKVLARAVRARRGGAAAPTPVAAVPAEPNDEGIVPLGGVRFQSALPESSAEKRSRQVRRFVAALKENPGEWAEAYVDYYWASARELERHGCETREIDGRRYARWAA